MERILKAALFDLDGTLIDTEGQYTRFWDGIAKQYCPDIPDFANTIKGTTLVQIFKNYFPDKQIQDEIARKLDEFEASMDFTPYPGVLDFILDLKKEGITMENVTSSSYGSHYGRSREEFWLAEGVRKMSEENCPGEDDEFAELANDMYHHVADTYEDVYENAFKRLKAVTKQSLSFPKKDRIISGELGAAELKGVCFQLSNEDKLIWKEK